MDLCVDKLHKPTSILGVEQNELSLNLQLSVIIDLDLFLAPRGGVGYVKLHNEVEKHASRFIDECNIQ